MHNELVEHGYIKTPTLIVGDLVRGEKVILYLHGNNTSIERQSVAYNMLHEATGLPLVLPEYSGHGDNQSATYEQSMPAMHSLEVVTVYDWLSDRVGEGSIIVYGTSYGGSLAATLMKWRNPQRVILFAPTVVLDEDLYVTRGEKSSLSVGINAQSLEEAVHNVTRATGGRVTDIAILKCLNDDLVDSHVVDAWHLAFPGSQMINLEHTSHSVRQSSPDGQKEWLEGMQKVLDLQ